jgi:hypothetical protein
VDPPTLEISGARCLLFCFASAHTTVRADNTAPAVGRPGGGGSAALRATHSEENEREPCTSGYLVFVFEDEAECARLQAQHGRATRTVHATVGRLWASERLLVPQTDAVVLPHSKDVGRDR